MAASSGNTRIPHHPEERNLWFSCMAIRGGCAVAALIAAMSCSLSASLFVAGTLVAVLTGVDSAYKSSIRWLQLRRRQMAKKRRLLAAEEARLERLRQFEAAKREAAEKYFDPSLMTLGKAMPAGAPGSPPAGEPG